MPLPSQASVVYMTLCRQAWHAAATRHICRSLAIILSSFISKTKKVILNSGRGAFETMGAGADMSFDDIAFKCNFAYVNDETGIVERRRVDREFHWGVSLCDALDGLKIPGFGDYQV
jgi:hypothetical protein